MNHDIFLKMYEVTKYYPGVKALDNVQLEVRKGEIHAICGENGAGKSTLINVLAGNYHMDSGVVEIEGKEVHIKSHMDSLKLGISVVYQERSLVSNLTVAENIFADRQPTNFLGLIDRKKMDRDTEDICKLIHLNISPSTLVGQLAPAEQQMVEIAKALSIQCKLLILDEPTATISDNETKVLFDVVKGLKEKGISVIYISHRLQEIFEIADRVSVLKDGKYISTKEIESTGIEEIIWLMVGRDLVYEEYVPHFKDEIVLEAHGLKSNRFKDINFKLKRGEILGFSGLAGAGRTEVFRGIIGADRLQEGEILVEGKSVKISNTQVAIKNGIGYMPEDRKEQGLFLSMSVAKNIVSGNLEEICDRSIINEKKARNISKKYKDMLKIATPSVDKTVGELSGGNQQKVVFAKWLLVNPKILVIDEPTRGVDVGTKSEIYKIIRQLSAKGTSIVVISSDLPEILTISDRIIVMHEGCITGELDRSEASEEIIMKYASGIDQTEMN